MDEARCPEETSRVFTLSLSDARAAVETFDVDEARMAAVTMEKPDKEILERGFKRVRTKTLDDSVEHEGVAETLGEREVASAASEETEETASFEENDVMMRKEIKEVFPHVLRLARGFNTAVSAFVRVPAQVLVTFVALVTIPTISHVQVLCTLLCFWAIVSR